MNRIKTRKNRGLTTVIYTDETAGRTETAVRLLVLCREIEGFEPGYAALRDLDRSADEGNHSRQLRTGLTEEEIMAALAEQPCGKLYVSGKYQGVRTGIGINMKTSEVSVTLPGEHVALADEIVAKLPIPF